MIQSSESGIAPTIDITGEKYGIIISTSTNNKAIDERCANRFHENSIKERKVHFEQEEFSEVYAQKYSR